MQQPKTVITITADPMNANVPDGAFITTAGLTPRRAIIKPKIWTRSKKSTRLTRNTCTYELRGGARIRAYLDVITCALRLSGQ